MHMCATIGRLSVHAHVQSFMFLSLSLYMLMYMYVSIGLSFCKCAYMILSVYVSVCTCSCMFLYISLIVCLLMCKFLSVCLSAHVCFYPSVQEHVSISQCHEICFTKPHRILIREDSDERVHQSSLTRAFSVCPNIITIIIIILCSSK